MKSIIQFLLNNKSIILQFNLLTALVVLVYTYFMPNLIHILIILFISETILTFFLIKINDSYLGGHIGYARFSSDPEAIYVILGYIPILGSFLLSFRLDEKLKELKSEMKKQGVTKLEDFKPLPRKSKNLL